MVQAKTLYFSNTYQDSKVGCEVHTGVGDSTCRWSLLSPRVSWNYEHVYSDEWVIACRFLTYMPPGAVFVAFGIVLRSTEGVGWAMGKTTTLALLPYLYPSHVGLLAVCLTTAKESINFSDIYNYAGADTRIRRCRICHRSTHRQLTSISKSNDC